MNASTLLVSSKKLNLEFLRTFAIILVIFNHTGTRGFFLFAERQNSVFYGLYLFSSVLCKVAVPLFFMISGALLIPKEETVKDVFKKRVSRIIAVILIFSFLFYLYFSFKENTSLNMAKFFKSVYSSSIVPAYWYLYSYLGTLIMLPLLRRMARGTKKKEFIYLFLCQIVIVGIIPIVQFLIFQGAYTINRSFSAALITSSNIFHFIMGHFLENVLKKEDYTFNRCMKLVILSVLAIVICSAMTHYRAQITDTYKEADSQLFHNSLIAVPTLCIYYCTKYIFDRRVFPMKAQKIFCFLGSLSFGIMLVERFFKLELEFIFDMMDGNIWTIAACIIYVVLIYITSGAVTAILKKIPIIKQLL